MKAYTDITLLVDRSGSMQVIQESMESAYKEFIKGHQEVKSTRVTLIQFDSVDKQEIVYQDVPVKYVDPLRIHPRGNTPLIDAMCEAIDGVGKRLANKPENERPDQVLFVVITDGEENSSTKYKRADVQARVTKQNEAYKWQFIYLGANQDAIREAQSFGINHNHAITYNHNSIGTTSAMASLMGNTVNYANAQGGLRGMATGLAFTKEQREEAAESDKK